MYFSENLIIVFNFSLRLIFLAILIFSATTLIPKTELSLQTRIIISVVVVIIYSLLDVLGRYLKNSKDKLCEWVCGSSTTF